MIGAGLEQDHPLPGLLVFVMIDERFNSTAPGNGAMALLLQIRHLRRAVPEQQR